MKKKKILFIILSIVILTILLSVIVFLNFRTTKIKCELSRDYPDFVLKRVYVFEFNNKSELLEYEERYEYIYENAELANKDYKNFEGNFYLEKNKIFEKNIYKIKGSDDFYIKTKEDAIKIFRDEYGYECK